MTLHTGVHNFDLARQFTALEAERVSCEMAKVATRRTEDNFSAVLRMHVDAVYCDRPDRMVATVAEWNVDEAGAT